MGTANEQSELWGARARDYAEVQEGVFASLFQAVLDNLAVSTETKLLDIGCGSGIFCQMAANKGARVSGLDATESLLLIAGKRVPKGDFRVGEMEELPYSSKTFNVITGFNSFQFAANPVNALKEAHRVSQPGASVVIGVFGKRKDTEAAAYLAAVGSLLPPPSPDTPGPFVLSADGALEELAAAAGLTPVLDDEVNCLWDYPDEQTALRGFLSTGPSVRAIQHSGEEAVRHAVLEAIEPFRTESGGYRLNNKARYLMAHVS